MSCTVLLKKIIRLGSGPRLGPVQEKAPEGAEGDTTFLPYSSSRNMERKPWVAGGGIFFYTIILLLLLQLMLVQYYY